MKKQKNLDNSLFWLPVQKDNEQPKNGIVASIRKSNKRRRGKVIVYKTKFANKRQSANNKYLLKEKNKQFLITKKIVSVMVKKRSSACNKFKIEKYI